MIFEIREIALKSIIVNLSERNFFVEVVDEEYSLKDVVYGVTHESILGHVCSYLISIISKFELLAIDTNICR